MAGLVCFTRSGGTVNPHGQSDEQHVATLELDGGTGSWNLAGGTVGGGTITDTGGALLVLTNSGGTLAGVTIPAGTTIDGTEISNANATVTNGLTLNGVINLGDTANNYGHLYFFLSQTLAGSGTINFGASQNNAIYAQGNNGTIPGTLTIGIGIVVQGKGGAIQGYFTIDAASLLARLPRPEGGGTASGGIPGTFTNGGTITVASGALAMQGPFTNQAGGIVMATGATLTLGSSNYAWSNLGAITATSSITNLGGAFSVAGLGAFTRTGGTVNLTGSLTNSNATLALNSVTGSWDLAGGTVVGGTITDTGGALLVLTNAGGTLAGVTIPAGTTIDGTEISNANATVTNGLTLNGVINLGDTANNYGHLFFFLSQALNGSGTINFGASQNNAIYGQGNNGIIPGTLTIGSGIVVQGKAGAIQGYFTIDAVVNDGTIAETGGGTFNVSGGIPGTFTNGGTITVASGALAIWPCPLPIRRWGAGSLPRRGPR